jgi:glycosyltransferase involved in cell wall biosynthesis
MTPHLSIIITVHNRLEYTKRTLESLFASVPWARFFIIDNDSTEAGMYEYLKSVAGKNVKVIMNGNNEGWGASVNEAIRLMDIEFPIKTEFLLISNNDVVYQKDWFQKLFALYEKYPKVGIMGVWKHTAHGTREDFGDMVSKDNMPAVGWLLKRSVMSRLGFLPEHGPCETKGGNGEDTGYAMRALEQGYLVAAPKEDVAVHIDGY